MACSCVFQSRSFQLRMTQKTCNCPDRHFETRLSDGACSVKSANSCLLESSLESILTSDREEKLSLAGWRGSSGPVELKDSVSNSGDD
jgi:hypothetical protein